ncbi:dehydrogenase/reductase SDR family member 7B-like [Physella acuta]|uniref:dehydrogenase/reductase SDR family member 7B-like n=1 Tax=Physella acuta TaxID=109671 RepID=UPI0027DAD6A3|nr:dehydrogenase/reductase SDR family member 7B-like [Physella acuta]
MSDNTTLWTVIGLPLGLLSLIGYLYRRRKKVDVKNKVVLITGASSGLGEACAEVFFNAGCKLILSGRNLEKLTEVKERLIKNKKANANTPALVVLDLENFPSIPSKVDEAVSAFGHIDILINNAGMSYRGQVIDTKLDVDMKLMAVNFFGHIEITKAVAHQMIKQGEGQILTVSSLQGRLAIPHRSAYTASKHAIQAYFDSLRAELSGYNINVCVVSPHYISTNLSLNAVTSDGSVYGKMDKTTQSGLKPEYVANQILYCITHKQSELTLAPLYVRLVIGLRVLAPWLYFKIMEHRAKKEQSLSNKKD